MKTKSNLYLSNYTAGSRFLHTIGEKQFFFTNEESFIQHVLDNGQHFTASINADGSLTRIKAE